MGPRRGLRPKVAVLTAGKWLNGKEARDAASRHVPVTYCGPVSPFHRRLVRWYRWKTSGALYSGIFLAVGKWEKEAHLQRERHVPIKPQTRLYDEFVWGSARRELKRGTSACVPAIINPSNVRTGDRIWILIFFLSRFNAKRKPVFQSMLKIHPHPHDWGESWIYLSCSKSIHISFFISSLG